MVVNGNLRQNGDTCNASHTGANKSKPRELPSEGRGREFESRRARQISMTYQMASCTIDCRRGTRCRLVFNLRLSDSSDAAVPAGGKKESDAACHVRLDLSA
jgi:hypothetical protein